MSKGHKEAKRPKRVTPAAKPPVTGTPAPAPGSGFNPMPGKR